MKRIPFFLLLSLIIISCGSLPDRSAYVAPEQFTPGLDGLEFGICHAGYSRTEEEYALLDSMAIEWLRVDFRWGAMEKEKGQWDFSSRDDYVEKAHSEGRKVLAILDYDTAWIHDSGEEERYIPPEHIPDFLNYVETVVNRYGDKLGAVEIWNEPNTSRFWRGSDEEFFQLNRETLDLLDEIAPDLPVAVGSVFYFHLMGAEKYIERLADSGILDKADALAIHPYSISERVVENRVTEVREILREKGYATPIWITEIGFPTGGSYPHRLGLDSQANGVARYMTRLAASGVELIVWYCLFDSYKPEDVKKGMSSEAFFGLVWPDYPKTSGAAEEDSEIEFRPQYQLKPGAIPYALIASELAGTTFYPHVWDFSSERYEKLYQAHFQTDDDVRKIVLWSSGPKISIDPGFRGDVLESATNLITGDSVSFGENHKIIIKEDPILLIYQ